MSARIGNQVDFFVIKARSRLVITIIVIAVLFSLAILMPNQMLLAADGVNYERSIRALNEEGVLSTYPGLFFQPAGYPLLIWLFSIFGLIPSFFVILSLQICLYAYSVNFLVNRIEKTFIKPVGSTLFVFLIFNPILCISAINCGYESIATSISMLILGILVSKNRLRSIEISSLSSLLTVLIFMNTKFIALAIFVTFYVFITQPMVRKQTGAILFFALCVTLPIVSLTIRNYVSVGISSPAINSGVTLNWGAGFDASGAHNIYGAFGVACPEITGSETRIMGKNEIVSTFFNFTDANTPAAVAKYDRVLRDCVIKWYAQNPSELSRLFFYKTLYFFSPFTGPISTGTFEINNIIIERINANLQQATSNEVERRILSSIYLLFSLAILFLCLNGFRKISRLNVRLASLLGGLVVIQWAISAFTIGDNRFRIPAVPIFIFLAIVGLTNVKTELKSSKLGS